MRRNRVLGQLIRIQTQFGGGRAANVRHLHCSNMHGNISGIVTLILLHSPFFLSRAVPYISVTQLMNRAHLTPCLVSDSRRENGAEKWQHCITRSATAGITLFTAERTSSEGEERTSKVKLFAHVCQKCSTFLPIEMPFGNLSKRTRAGLQIDQHHALR